MLNLRSLYHHQTALTHSIVVSFQFHNTFTNGMLGFFSLSVVICILIYTHTHTEREEHTLRVIVWLQWTVHKYACYAVIKFMSCFAFTNDSFYLLSKRNEIECKQTKRLSWNEIQSWYYCNKQLTKSNLTLKHTHVMQTHLKPNHWFIYIEIKRIEFLFSPKVKRTCKYVRCLSCALQCLRRLLFIGFSKKQFTSKWGRWLNRKKWTLHCFTITWTWRYLTVCFH